MLQMNRPISAAVVGPLAILLAACAAISEQAEPSPDRASAVSLDALESAASAELPPAAAYTAIPAGKLHASMLSRRQSLSRLLTAELARGDLAAAELRDDNLWLDWRSAALFANARAQLQAQALVGLSRVARWLRADGASVLQIVGRQIAADPDQLAERRVAAIAAFLIAEGAPAPRIRAQVVDISQSQFAQHSSTRAVDGFTLVVAAIVAGREALAWVPPADY